MMTKRKKKVGILLLALAAIGGAFAGSVLYRVGRVPSAEDEKRYAQYPYYDRQNKKFMAAHPLRFFRKRITGGELSFSRFFSRSENAPEGGLPVVPLAAADFSPTPDSLALYWLGHSSAILELDGNRLLIDPVLSNAFVIRGIVPRFQPAPIKRKELPDVDAVLITHDHYDHLEYATMAALKNRGVRFVVPLGVGARLKGWGIDPSKITELGWNESTTVGGVTVTACESLHQSKRSRNDHNKTLWAGYAIKGDSFNLFWSGDSGNGDHFREIGQMYGPFDLACVEIDAWNPGWPDNHLFPEQAVDAAKAVNAARMLPIHWGVFDLAMHRWNESITAVARIAQEKGVELVTPLMGQKYIPGKTETHRWWSDESVAGR